MAVCERCRKGESQVEFLLLGHAEAKEALHPTCRLSAVARLRSLLLLLLGLCVLLALLFGLRLRGLVGVRSAIKRLTYRRLTPCSARFILFGRAVTVLLKSRAVGGHRIAGALRELELMQLAVVFAISDVHAARSAAILKTAQAMLHTDVARWRFECCTHIYNGGQLQADLTRVIRAEERATAPLLSTGQVAGRFITDECVYILAAMLKAQARPWHLRVERLADASADDARVGVA